MRLNSANRTTVGHEVEATAGCLDAALWEWPPPDYRPAGRYATASGRYEGSTKSPKEEPCS